VKGMRCNHVIDLQTDVTDVLDGHAKRVALYTELLLTELVRRGFQEIKQPDILKIKHATLLHDIGKCFIPKAILNKKGRLTDEEYAIVKLHTIKGAELIARCEDVLECHDTALSLVREITLCHHERWDGNGYPYRLSGNEIPVTAQIVSLADQYDALRSKRCYKGAYSHTSVVELIVKERGQAFRPEIADAFLDIQDLFGQLACSEGEKQPEEETANK
jgi:putative two-component system response regulator